MWTDGTIPSVLFLLENSCFFSNGFYATRGKMIKEENTPDMCFDMRE